MNDLETRAARAIRPRAVATAERHDGGTATVRTTDVKLTIELAPADHREFKRWCDDAADRMGMSTVHGKAVFRAMVALLVDNPDAEFSHQVRRAVADAQKVW